MPRRKQQLKYKNKKSVNKNVDSGVENIDKLLTHVKKEKKAYKNKANNNNILFKASLIIIPIIIVGVLFSGSLSNPQIGNVNPYPERTLPSDMPNRYDQTLTNGPQLEEAYAYATTNPVLLSQLVCYCGCNNAAHQPYHENNKECFYTSTGAYEPHAENCSTCVYIALSAKTLDENAWSPSEIRFYIDSQYS
ncbi:MAG: hypothetical protein HeimC3_41700 [Candidatus Heimdallarchaeota archaeon LC_3]|nr:MAG: hypothetical protein HeimC3_41700 [Candidatus Heimdallarchaeota archaeon LC_3]